MSGNLRGLDKSQEQKSSQLIRDTRSLSKKLYDYFDSPERVVVLLAILVVASFILPAVADIIAIIMLGSFLSCVLRRHTLPFRLPQIANTLDYNDLAPGSGKPNKSRGIYLFGNDKGKNEELWFSNEDMRTHVLIFGSTGSGKTEALVGLAYNALLQASGIIYVDGKGDNSLWAKIVGLARFMGRDDDVLLINFMTGARDIVGPQENKLSNTLNPFATGSSSMLAQLVVSMMGDSSSSGDGDMWKGRAIAFVEALMKVLVAMRDSGQMLLDANTIRNYFGLERIIPMARDNAFMRDNQSTVSLENLPEVVMQPIQNYLKTLPGYNPDRKDQVSQVWEQHGYITMQLTRVFTSLADTYGHILRTKLAEVDLKDVVLNRRILVALLPALEKSPDELSNLGKIIIATLRTMMAAGLGEEVEGEYKDLVTRKPTNAPNPFLCILDEYGYYAVKGFAVVPAQARSLGFSVVFAGQDLPAFQKVSKEEAASIGANTNIKICMKLEDPIETWDFFNKTAGEAFVTQVESFHTEPGSVTMSYMDSKGAKVEKRQRIDLRDLKEQVEGDMHIFFKSGIVRARTFYANPPSLKYMKMNHFLKVDLPLENELYNLVKGIEDFESLCRSNMPEFEEREDSIRSLANIYRGHIVTDSLNNAALRTVISLESSGVTAKAQSEAIDYVALDAIRSKFNIFADVVFPDGMADIIHSDYIENATSSLLDIDVIRGVFTGVEKKIAGLSGENMDSVVEVLSDIALATEYNLSGFEIGNLSSLSELFDRLNKQLRGLKVEDGD